MAKDSNCSACPMSKYMGQKRVPVYQGGSRVGEALFEEIGYRGNTRAEIVVVGEPPEPMDLYRKQYMGGESGKLVERELRQVGLDPSRMFFAGATRCNMFGKKDMSAGQVGEVLSGCKPPLDRVLKIIKPKLVICMGADALKQVTKQTGITQKRGKLIWSKEYECWVFPTFGPGYVRRDEKNFAHWRPDIAQIAQIVKSGYKPVTAEETGTYQDVDSLQFLLDKTGITVAFDTETQGNDWCDPNSVVISYSVSDDPKSGYNVWLMQECEPDEAETVIQWTRGTGKSKAVVDVPVKKMPDYERRIEELREMCRRPDIKMTMMNGNYDLHRLRQLGIPRSQVVNYTLDIQTAAHALDPDNFKGASMLDIKNAFLPGQADHKTAFGNEVNKADMLAAAKEDPARHTNYACADTAVTLGCANVLRHRLMADKELARYYVLLAHPVESQVLYTIEKNGIRFDREKLPEVKGQVADLMRQKENEFISLVPHKVIEKHRTAGSSGNGLKLTRGAFVQDVFFSKQGFGLKPERKTPTGDPSTKREELVRLRDSLDDGDPAREALTRYIEWGPYQKLFSTYLKGFETAVKPDGRLHTQISKTFTATGRTGCIRKGSLVEVVRDLAQHPEGIPIEDVRQGDYVYSFDDRGLPTVRRVTWAGKTGTRSLVRVKFRNIKGDDRGHLDLTPEHRVRLSTGEYVEAQHLQPNMSVCSVNRGVHNTGYARLWLTNRGEVREHRFVYEAMYGQLPEGHSVHHRDGSKLNNLPSNLESIRNEDHTILHVEQGDIPPKIRIGEVLGRFKLLRMLSRSKGRPTQMGHDFESIKRALADVGIDWFEVSKRYNRREQFLSRGMVKSTLDMTQNQALEYLGVGYYRWKELLEFYGFQRERKWANQCGPFTPRRDNHLVESVIWLREMDEVYDLEVEGTHNFVVNGVSVHNSRNPNLQNIPKRNKAIMKLIRSLLVASPGKVLVPIDYSQAELRWIAHDSRDPEFMRVYNAGEDIHLITGLVLAEMAGLDPKKLTPEQLKEFRQKAKACVDPNSVVQTATGLRRYGAVQVGDRIWSGNGFHTVLDRLTVQHKKMVWVVANTGAVRVSIDHPMIMSDGSVKQAGELAVGELLWRGPNAVMDDSGVIHTLTINPFTLCRKHSADDIELECPPASLFETKLDAKWAYWAGLFMGDGSFNTGKSFSITAGEGESFKEWRKVLQKATADLGFPQGRSGGKSAVRVNSTYATKILRKLGLGSTSGKKELSVPEWILRGTSEIRSAFLAGLVDTDGTINKNGGVSICTKSIQLASELLVIGSSLGLEMRIQPDFHKQYARWYWKVKILGRSIEMMADKIPLRCPWKIERLQQLKNAKRQNGYRDFADAKVLLILEDGDGPCFDIEVDHPSHQFIAGGIAVHNCNFGLSYGQSAKGFQIYARDSYGVNLTLEEAEKFRVAFFRKYRGLESWHQRRIREAQKNGFVRTDYGFIRRTPSIHNEENYKRAEDERVAVNTPIQSASNDSALLAALEGMRMNVIDDNIAKLVLFVHDELIFEVDEDRVDVFIPQILDVMQNLPTQKYFGFDLAVPFLAEASTCTVLSEPKEYHVEKA